MDGKVGKGGRNLVSAGRVLNWTRGSFDLGHLPCRRGHGSNQKTRWGRGAKLVESATLGVAEVWKGGMERESVGWLGRVGC